jgi:3-oxoacyl-[acyl-carrier protein] reductase
MDIRLDGRSAIVTGGSKGLGLAIAKEFAASGANVAILARDQASLNDAKAEVEKAAAKGVKVLAISCDVSKAGPIEAACAQCNSEFGKVDIFVIMPGNRPVAGRRPLPTSSGSPISTSSFSRKSASAAS